MSNKGYHEVIKKSSERVEHYLLTRNYGRAFAHFLVLFRLNPELLNNSKMSEDFNFCLGQLGVQLENRSKIQDLFHCYEQALELFPLNEKLHTNFASHLFRLEYWDQAAVYFKRAIQLDPTSIIAKCFLDNLYNALVERWHFPMLNCKSRNEKYKNAIGNAIARGHNIVLDIGAGTGILSMFAVQDGAKETYACEMSNCMYKLAQEILKANQMEQQIQLIHKKSTEMVVPVDIKERVSLVVTETFDAALFGEHILETLVSAWDNLLLPSKPEPGKLGGLVIPIRAVVWACAIQAETIRNFNCPTWTKGFSKESGLQNLILVSSPPDNDVYSTERLSELKGGFKSLCHPIQIMTVDFNDCEGLKKMSQSLDFNLPIICTESGTLDAVAVWFDLYLDDDNIISTNPNSTTCWEQAIFPVTHYYQVWPGRFFTLKVLLKNGNLKLICSQDASESLVNYMEKSKIVPVQLGCFAVLSDRQYADAMIKTLKDHCPANEQTKVLISSWATTNAVYACQCNVAEITCMLSSHNSDTVKWVCETLLSIKTIIVDSEETVFSKGPVWNVLVTNVIEGCGIINNEAMSEVALLRETVLAPPFKIIPSMVQCWAVIIESDILAERNRVCNDERTIGLQIAKYINCYQVATHQDIDLASLKHVKLSDPLRILDINFMVDSKVAVNKSANRITNTAVTQIKTKGNVTAIAYWFIIQLTDDISVSTLDPQTHWRQAAVILKEEISVAVGQTVYLKSCVENGFLDIALH